MDQKFVVPLVLLIDLDNTIIGNILPQVCLYDLGKFINKKLLNLNTLKVKLRNGIIRPYFKSFFEDMSNHGIPIFVYTASLPAWGNLIIKQIEDSIGIKFNRPIFTRKNCTQQGSKSIDRVKPAIIRCLKKQHKFVTDKTQYIAIDNNNVWVEKDQNNLIICKSYEYMIPENVPLTVNMNLYQQYYPQVLEILQRYGIHMKATKNYYKFEKYFYEYYVQMLQESIESREAIKFDRLFKILKMLAKIKINHDNIQYVNKLVNS